MEKCLLLRSSNPAGHRSGMPYASEAATGAIPIAINREYFGLSDNRRGVTGGHKSCSQRTLCARSGLSEADAFVGTTGSEPAIPVKSLIPYAAPFQWLGRRSWRIRYKARTGECFISRQECVSAQARLPAATPQSDCARQLCPCPRYRRLYHDRRKYGSPASRP